MNKKALITLVFFFCTSGNSYSDNYSIGLENINYPPLYEIKNGEVLGESISRIRDIFNKNNHTLTIKTYPVRRLYSEFFQGRIDFKFPDNEVWNLEHKKGSSIYYSKPIAHSTDGYYAYKKTISFDKVKSIGIIRGFTPTPSKKELTSKGISITKANSISSLIKLLKRKRVQAIYCSISICSKYITNDEIEFKQDFPKRRYELKLSTLKHPRIINEINNFL